MNIIHLTEILNQGNDAIAAASTFLGLKMAQLDCSNVETISSEQLTLLFSKIPETWEFEELGKVMLSESMSETLGLQFLDFVNNRNSSHSTVGKTSKPYGNSQTSKPIVKDAISKYSNFPSPLKTLASNIFTSLPSPHPLHPIKVLDQVIAEYRDYLLTEFRAKDPQLKAALEKAIDKPLFLAQEPFYQAHRPFKTGEKWHNLPIDAKLAQVMQQRSRSEFAYLHQSQAIDHLLGDNASSLVVTTGTGSGKTEAFLLPVIQNAIEDAAQFRRKPGLTAILVYPMNALANDQLLRIQNYLEESGWDGAITVAKYDRGTTQKERQALRQNPPHILLTNYMMLEYLLVRPADREDIFANHRCRFLVLDEVHTYRGTLGSNIALLVRRLRTHLANAKQDWCCDVHPEVQTKRYPKFLPVATSATIKSVAEGEHTLEDRIRLRDDAVQEFFSKISGVDKPSIRVIGEELAEIQTPPEAVYPLQPVNFADLDVTKPEAVRKALCALGGMEDNNSDTLSSLTSHFRLLWDLNRWLIRSPLSIAQIVNKVKQEISQRSHFPYTTIENEVRTALLVGAALPEGTPGALQLRAHRFIRGGWQFHRCVNPNCGKLYPMGEERCECGSSTAPLYLCRNCGADYLRFVGEPTSAPLQPSAVPGEEQEWMLYDPNRFEMNADLEEDIDETEATPQK